MAVLPPVALLLAAALLGGLLGCLVLSPAPATSLWSRLPGAPQPPPRAPPLPAVAVGGMVPALQTPDLLRPPPPPAAPRPPLGSAGLPPPAAPQRPNSHGPHPRSTASPALPGAAGPLGLLGVGGLLLAAWWWWRRGRRPDPGTVSLWPASGEREEGRVDKGLDLLSRAGRLVPQGALVGTAKEAWKFAWTRLMTELAPRDSSGNYQRPRYTFTGRIGTALHPMESGRYHVYLGNPCPWCHRVALVLALRGLQAEGHVTSSRLLDDPLKASRGGWAFSAERPDPIYGCRDLYEVYDRLAPGYSGRCTAPLLIDVKAGRVVSNESADIVAMLAAAPFSDSPRGRRDLRPAALTADVARTAEWVYRQLNNGVYRCGFATTQAAYDAAAADVRAGLARAEQLLARQPFLCGPHVTEADVWLLPTVLRFDAVYAPFFKAGGVHLRIRDYPALQRWLQRCWALEDLSATFDLADAQRSYYQQLFPLSPGGIVPTPPTLANLGLASDRPLAADTGAAFAVRPGP